MKSKGMLKFVISVFSVLLLLSGCSSKPSLDLVSSKVELRNDEERLGGVGITSGEKKGEIIVPIALSYDFVLKNTGKKSLGETKKLNEQNYEFDDGIKVSIEPNEKLKAVSEEVMGINIYDEEGHIGLGRSILAVLEPNQEGTYTFDYILGALEKNPDLKLAPSSEVIRTVERTCHGCIFNCVYRR